MQLRLPRPCRYEDLAEAARRGEVPALAVIVDGLPENVQAGIDHWRELLPEVALTLLPLPWNVEAAAAAEGIAGARLLPFDEQTAPECALWATCQPYDAFGTYVKQDIELFLSCHLRKNDGLFLVHDPNYRFFRPCTWRTLEDRVVARGRRIRFYKAVCERIFRASRLLNSLFPTPEGWRKL